MEKRLAASLGARYKLRHYDTLLAIFVGTLLVSNIGSTKIIDIGPFVFDGGTILFPLIYILGDMITEVYGFKMARRAIWLGFFTMILATLTLGLVQLLPAASGSTTHESFNQIVGFIPRITIASLAAYMIGQYINTTLISRLKIKMQGKSYWLRSLSSSSIGELIDTTIFSVIAFAGTMPGSDLLALIGTVYLLKVAFEILVLPLSSYLVRRLKKAESLDVYDKNVHYTLFDRPVKS